MKEYSVFSNRTHVWVGEVEDGEAGATLVAVERAHATSDEFVDCEALANALESAARRLRMAAARKVVEKRHGPSVRLDEKVTQEKVR